MSSTQLYNLARMRAVAADIETEGKELKQCIDQLLDIKNNIAAVWENESCDSFRLQFENLLSEMRTVYADCLPDREKRVTEQVDAVAMETGARFEGQILMIKTAILCLAG